MLPGSQSTYNTHNHATHKSTWRAPPVRQWVGDPRLPVRRAEQTNMDDRKRPFPHTGEGNNLRANLVFPLPYAYGNYLTTILSIIYSAILIPPFFWCTPVQVTGIYFYRLHCNTPK